MNFSYFCALTAQPLWASVAGCPKGLKPLVLAFIKICFYFDSDEEKTTKLFCFAGLSMQTAASRPGRARWGPKCTSAPRADLNRRSQTHPVPHWHQLPPLAPHRLHPVAFHSRRSQRAQRLHRPVLLVNSSLRSRHREQQSPSVHHHHQVLRHLTPTPRSS